MMRRPLLSKILLASVVVAVIGGGCRTVGITGSGKIVRRSFSFGSFTRLIADRSFDVNLASAESQSVTVLVDDNLVNRLDVRVSDGTLILGLKARTVVRRATLKADVSAPKISTIDLRGASRLHLKDPLDTPSLTLRVSGSSEIDGPLKLEEAGAQFSGASTASFTGTIGRFTLAASGATHIEGLDLEIQTLEVTLFGASEAELSVSNSINARLSGASKLRYHGNPTVLNKQTSGASTVSQI